MDSLYNIAPDGKAQIFTREQIIEASQRGPWLLLNVGKHHPPVKCRLAATVRGWCTVVLEKGGIIQEWAGSFTTYYGSQEPGEEACTV